MAVNSDVALNDNRIISLINEFNSSPQRKLMIQGEQYYKVDNDILNRKIYKTINGKKVEETFKANNKLAHSKYKSMVDEKIAYLLSKPYSLKCSNEEYLKNIKDKLGKHFGYTLTGLGYEASNKGIAWLMPYISEDGKFKTMIIPSEQCIPIWKDKNHIELDMMIRVYSTYIWKYDERKKIKNVEVWTNSDVKYYKEENNILIPYYEMNFDNGGPVAHYKKGDLWQSWGKVPFIPFKNNRIETPDIKFVKSLLDGYDLSRSEAANYVEEVKNLIYVLKGYGGEDLNKFMKNLNENRAIIIDDVEDGDVDTLNPSMDITALREHYEQLKRDIVEDGQSINKDLDKFGSAPSGVALKFMYSGLDLKCNALETEFKMGFEELLYFINKFISINGRAINEDVEIIFNRDIEINESEVIDNCTKSKGTISDRTILANHPWVTDIDEEKEQIKSEVKESQPEWDEILIEDNNNE